MKKLLPIACGTVDSITIPVSLINIWTTFTQISSNALAAETEICFIEIFIYLSACGLIDDFAYSCDCIAEVHWSLMVINVAPFEIQRRAVSMWTEVSEESITTIFRLRSQLSRKPSCGKWAGSKSGLRRIYLCSYISLRLAFAVTQLHKDLKRH